MSVAVADLRSINAGVRCRSVAELHADLASGCESLGALGAEWRASGFVPEHDLAAVDRTIVGLHRLLVDLRIARRDGQ